MIPIKLKIENFMSYEEAELDFTFSSALIVGTNGAGKSSILTAIAWVLFGKSKYKISDNIVKRGKVEALGELTFEHDKRTYRVVRKRNSKYASKNSLEFFELLGCGEEKQIKSDTNGTLDAKIRDVVKSSYDVFINTSYFRQGHMSEFINGTAKARQDIISSILNLDRWDTYADLANKELKATDKLLSVVKYK